MTADWQQEVADNARRYAELQDRVAQLSITEATADGMIRVTVSADGLLTDLALHQRYQGVPMGLLGTRIMACVRRAQARIPELLHQAMLSTVGVDDPAAQATLAQAQHRFPAAPAEMAPRPAPVARPRARVRQSGEDADWDNAPVMQDVENDL
jgi:hypothetical protein